MRASLAPLMALLAIALASVPSFGEEPSASVERGIAYGQGGDRDLELDLARPATGEGPFPALVFIHGGGWRAGSRSAYLDEIQRAAQRGYVAVTVSYRLTNVLVDGQSRYTFPDQVHDVKCAVRWLRAHAEKYSVDPNRIGVTGGSAGGHLSLLVGLTDSSDGLEGGGGYADHSSQVHAVVNYFGPTDLARCFETSPGAVEPISQFLRGTPDELADRYRTASPVTYVDENDPPVLTIHGGQDTLVPLEQAQRLDETMKAQGASHTLLILADQGHGFRDVTGDLARAAMFAFFDKHLKSGSSKLP